MTIFDLLFIVLFLGAAGTLVAALVEMLRGRRAHAGRFSGAWRFAPRRTSGSSTSRRLSPGAWCCAWEIRSATTIGVSRWTEQNHASRQPRGLRREPPHFSRALRVAMRDNGAADVYLVDSAGRRYDPIPRGTQIPLNTLLQAGEIGRRGALLRLARGRARRRIDRRTAWVSRSGMPHHWGVRRVPRSTHRPHRLSRFSAAIG